MSGARWTDEQDAYLRANLDLTDAALAEELSKIGPVRNAHGVKHRRWTLRLVGEVVAARSAGGLKAANAAAGWPSMKGTPEERDAKYVRACLLALAEMHGLKVAA